MARSGGERGDWLREGRQPSATHPIEKTPQFRSSMARFAERAGDQLSKAFGALFSAINQDQRNTKSFAAFMEHLGQPAVVLNSPLLDARMAIFFEGDIAELLIAAMFGIEAANDSSSNDAAKAPTALEMKLIGEVAVCLGEALRDAFAPVADFDFEAGTAEAIEDDTLFGAKDMPSRCCCRIPSSPRSASLSRAGRRRARRSWTLYGRAGWKSASPNPV